MPSDLRIGGKIKTLREFRNLKQGAIANMLGISSSAYSRIEQNKAKLPVELAQQLADILEVSLTGLISQDNPILNFTYRDSVTVENGYVNNKFEMSKEAFDAIMQSKDAEISNLKDQVKNQQEQINNLTSLLSKQFNPKNQ